MPKRLLPFLIPFLILTALIGAGCGGKKSTTAAGVAITISPTSASVAGATTQQFTATVTGSTNTAVTWQVNGVTGGDATNGTISTSGLYTAPPVLPTTTTVSVIAIAQADTTKTAVSIVTLTAPAVTISISPPSATVAAGTTQQFTPTVTVTGGNTAVNWSVSNIPGGNATVGTISSAGVYTAPASPPKSAITVTATSQANTAFSASAPVTLQFGNASLNGTYVFLVNQGDNSSGSGFAYRGGTFQADGAGHITAGVSDANSAAGPANSTFTDTGTYSVRADGRGTLTFADASGPHTFSFALTSSTRGQVIAFDSTAVTSGFIRLQDQTAIAGVSGSFVFGMSGDNGGPAAAVGQLTFSGTTLTGTEDVNSHGSFIAGTGLVGSFAVAAGGRGTATLNSAPYAFYIIDAATLVLMNIDVSGTRTAGTAFAQSNTPFTTATLGSSAFFVSGSTVSGNKPYALAARFDTNAATSQFSGGVADANNGGTVTSTPFTATYSVASNGRAQITGSSNFIVWLASQKQGVVLETDSTVVASGQLFQQQAGFQSVTGGYAFATAGANSAGTAAQAVDGQVTIAAFNSLSGTQDVNSSGSTPTSQTITGSLTIATNGRASFTSTSASVNYAFYFVTSDRFIMLSTDANTMLSGIAERQCSDCQF